MFNAPTPHLSTLPASPGWYIIDMVILSPLATRALISSGTCGIPQLRQIGRLIVLKVCPQCENTFRTYRAAAIYCSRQCQFLSMKRHLILYCSYCEQSFERARHVRKEGTLLNFCSPQCHTAYRQARAVHISCAYCKTLFYPKSTKIQQDRKSVV